MRFSDESLRLVSSSSSLSPDSGASRTREPGDRDKNIFFCAVFYFSALKAQKSGSISEPSGPDAHVKVYSAEARFLIEAVRKLLPWDYTLSNDNAWAALQENGKNVKETVAALRPRALAAIAAGSKS